jgi:protocatechuate 3,4-dioxygenase alpha subunit
MTRHTTPSQTVGPFFSIGCDRLKRADLAGPDVSGERIEVRGRVMDADGAGVPDAMLEMWQANAAGEYAHPEDTRGTASKEGFQGFGRVPTDTNGAFRFTTIKPGPVPGPNGRQQAPHIVVSVFMRGLLRRLVTRIYFPDGPANSEDFVLNLIEPERRGTLVARAVVGQKNAFAWDVVLQGGSETVFFDIGL